MAEAQPGGVPGVHKYFFFTKEKVSSDWKDLAFHLGFEKSDTDNIASSNRDDKSCCMDLLEEWLKRNGERATIEVLMDALSGAKLQSTVDGLREKYPELHTPQASSGQQEEKERKTEQMPPPLPIVVEILAQVMPSVETPQQLLSYACAKETLVDLTTVTDETLCLLEQVKPKIKTTKDLLNITKAIKKLEKISGVKVISVKAGSIVFYMQCTDLAGLGKLWFMYKSGELDNLLHDSLISEETLQQLSAESITVKATIKVQDFRKVLVYLLTTPVVKGVQTVLQHPNLLFKGQVLEILPLAPEEEEPAEATNADSDDNDDNNPEDATIMVSNLTQETSEDALTLYFENRRRSGGGEVINFEYSETRKEALITFESREVAERVLEREHKILGVTLLVRKPNPRFLDEAKILVKNISSRTTKDYLELFMEKVADMEVTDVDLYKKEGVAIVSFKDPVEIQTLIERSSGQTVHDRKLEFQLVWKPTAIVVSGISPTTSDDTLEMFFENKRRTGGDKVIKVERDELGDKATISFNDPDVVESVVNHSQLRGLVLDGARLEVRAQNTALTTHACIEEEPRSIPVTKPPPPQSLTTKKPVVFSIDDERKYKYINSHLFQQEVKANVEEVEGVLDLSRSGKVIVHPRQELTAVEWMAWETKCRAALEAILSKIDVVKKEVPANLWEALAQKIHECRERHQSVMFIEDRSVGEVVIVGHNSKAVRQADQLLNAVIEECRKKSTEVVIEEKVQPKKLRLLQTTGFLDEIDDMEIEIDISSGRVSLKGDRDAASKLMNGIFKKMSDFERRTVEVDELKRNMIMSEEGMEHVQSIFAAFNISAEYYIDENNELICIATTKKDGEAAMAVLESAIVTENYAVPKESAELCESPKWRKLKEELTGPLLLCKENTTIETTVLRLTGTKENVGKAKQRLAEFLHQNTLVNATLAVDVGTSRYLSQHGNIKEEVEAKLKQKRVSIMLNPEVDEAGKHVGGFLIRGTREGIDEACRLLRTRAAEVKTRRHKVQKPGMQHFLTEGTGRDSIKLIETTQKCVIELETVKPETPGAVGAIGGQEQSTQQICNYTRKDGREFVVLLGDLTSHHVDVMVNAANPELKHQGGLAKQIIDKGGKQIQEECVTHMESEGVSKLRPGTAFTTNSFALPCKLLVHAISPRWPIVKHPATPGNEDREDQAVKDLQHAVYRSLMLAENYRSIAIPAISTGMYGFPLQLAVETIVGAVEEFFKNYPSSKLCSVHFMDFGKPAVNAFCTELVKRYGDNVTMLDQHESSNIPAPSLAPTPMATAHVQPVHDAKNELTTSAGLKICLIEGDITDRKADVLVNSVGSTFDLKVGGVSKAFYLKGGDPLQKLCSSHGPVSGGQVIQTPPAGKLSCKEIYHACCPGYDKASISKCEKTLAEIVDNCLKKADSSGKESIAFPALGTGNLKYPSDTAARTMFERVMSFKSRKTKGSIKRVEFVVFDKPTVDAFRSELSRLKTIAAPSVGSAILRKERKGFNELDFGKVKLEVYQGDLLKAKVDAIVSVTDNFLGQRGGIAEAILKKAGDSVVAECKQKGRQQNGAVIMTGGGNHWNKIIHMVSPNETNLKSGVLTALNLAEQSKAHTIAFPAVGTGNAKIDPDDSARRMIDAVQEFAKKSPNNVKTVKIIVFQPKHLPHYEKELRERATSETMKPASEGFFKRRFQSFKKSVAEAWSSADREDKETELYLCYFAGDNATIEKVHTELESKMNKNLIDREITHDYVPHLTDEECADIKRKCRDLDVNVEIERDPVLKTIKLKGASHSFAEAFDFIYGFLNQKAEMVTEDKAAELLQKTVKWSISDPRTESKELLDPRSNKIIEDAFQRDQREVDFQIQRHGRLCRLKLDFSKYYATNLDTRERLKVSRRSIEDPKHWSPHPKDSSGQPVKVSEVKLDPKSEEYNEVYELFLGSIGDRNDNVKVDHIVRVQNPELHQQYNVKKLQLETKHPDRDVERQLFHGTSADTCPDINRTGFNRSYGGKNATVYGMGSYFAVDAYYSAQERYSPKDDHGRKRMYLAKVLVGEYTKGRGDLKDAPKKSDNPGETYDSVVDDVDNPRFFVIFKDAQAYPEYLITFSYV